MADSPETTKLSEVSAKLSQINQTEGVELGNIKALTKTLVDQGRATLLQQEAVAASDTEARKEAARAKKDKAGVQDVNVLNWKETKEEEGGGLFDSLKEMLMMKWSMGGMSLGSLFKKGGLKKLFLFLGTTLFTGIKTAFASVGVGIKGLLGPTLMKFLSPMALITGLVLAVKDGISAMGSSMDWGVGKISAFLGGFFGGEADGGVMNMFKNMGKWALIGAGIGSVVPVVGTLVGGLVGAAIGGLLGLIGAKRIAQAFSAVGAWLKKAWIGVSAFVKDIWNKVVTWFTSLWSWASEGIAAGWTGLTGFISEKWEQVKAWFFNALSWASEGLSAGWTGLSGFVSEKWQAVKKWFEDLLTFESEGGEKIGLGEKIIELFKKIPDKIVELFKSIVQTVKDIFSNISLPTWLGGEEKLTPEEAAQKRSELQTKLKVTQGKKLSEGFMGVGKFTEADRAAQIAEIQKELAAIPKLDTGGLVTKTGPAIVHKDELMLDNKAAGIFAQAAETLAQLQRARIDLNSEGPAGGNIAPTIINNSSVTNSSGYVLPAPALKVGSSNRLPTT